jgi:hypothetical protein
MMTKRVHKVFLRNVGPDRAEMKYEGEVIGYANWPIYMAAALLADMGVDPMDEVETWRRENDGPIMCLRGVIGDLVIFGVAADHIWFEGKSPQEASRYTSPLGAYHERRQQMAALQP